MKLVFSAIMLHRNILPILLLVLFTLMSCEEDDNIIMVDAKKLETKINLDAIPIIAHRGCWSGDSIPQNSLAAFRKALELNILGTEFDVRQTLDGKLVINHGVAFDSMTISKSTYEDLCQHRLGNGESIPLFEDFLRVYAATDTSVLMVVELKSCNIDEVLALLEQYDILAHCLFISFSRGYCDQLVGAGYGNHVLYLGSNMSPKDVREAGYAGVDFSEKVFQAHPAWLEEAQGLGLKVGVWTPNSLPAIEEYLSKKVIVTTDKVKSYITTIK
ncbi:MAG: hypothetical protein IJV36_01355 [Prevotella sp.]|nr:hypothetical protein [Prevotella sp.]